MSVGQPCRLPRSGKIAGSDQRVAERVAHGGHDIPAADIERRFGRSLRHLLNDFGHRVDLCRCFMNSETTPELVFEQAGSGRDVRHSAYCQQLLKESMQ